jgi:hypothetical protein
MTESCSQADTPVAGLSNVIIQLQTIQNESIRIGVLPVCYLSMNSNAKSQNYCVTSVSRALAVPLHLTQRFHPTAENQQFMALHKLRVLRWLPKVNYTRIYISMNLFTRYSEDRIRKCVITGLLEQAKKAPLVFHHMSLIKYSQR